MPLIIVRNDITKMSVDAIVNAAKESLLGGGGVDGCIHRAAGPELLQECRTLGGCRTGEAKITGAYRLPCKYVIHTVGPVWNGGKYGEREQLASCYRSSLALAKKHGCETVAFPLISSGVFGYPKDQTLRVAVDTISEFLAENDMTVYIVIFDRAAYQIGNKLFAGIAAYIDDHYVDAHTDSRRERTRRMGVVESRMLTAYEDATMAASGLDEALAHLDAGFSETLLRLIDRSGKKDAEVYKKANVDRKLFSKIRNNPDYKPSKPTAVAFAIALELNLLETRDLIARAATPSAPAASLMSSSSISSCSGITTFSRSTRRCSRLTRVCWGHRRKGRKRKMKLGKLHEVDIRKVWLHEQYDFSKWLAAEENIQELGNVLNLSLTDIETERLVGSYRCDILCRDEITGKVVLIENQLEQTNHDHLGKILTYASGLDASVVVWVVAAARDEHASAIEWLNKHTDDSISFFLIEIHAYKIGDSEPAPQFKIIEQPNDFAKIVKRISQDKGMNESQGCRLEFWTQFNDILEQRGKPFNKRKATTDHWYSVAVGSSECQISIDLVNKEHKIRVGLWIADSKERFDYMKQHKTEIEAAMGMALSWERLDNKNPL